MLYEYRRYEAWSGRMGMLVTRFQSHAVPAWKRHGVHVVGMWQTVIGESKHLHYILQWEDMAERERVWPAFQNDPEWMKAKRESETEGPLVLNAHTELWKPVTLDAPPARPPD